MLPNKYAINNLLENSSLLELTDSLRANKLAYKPFFSSTPKDDFTNVPDNAPWFRVTNIPFDEALFADNTRFIQYHRVQVDFWVKQKDSGQIQAIMEQVYQTMRGINYERYYQAIGTDADDNRLIMVTQNFEGYEERNEN